MSFIARIERQRNSGEMSAPISSARGTWSKREGLLLQLTDDEGRVGRGEASPLPGYSPDSLERCTAELGALDAASINPPAGPLAAWIERTLDGAALAAPSARFALETALLDLVAQRRGVTIADLLTDTPAASVPLSALIADMPSARAAVAAGHRSLKIKIGRPGKFDLELGFARALRAELGPDIALRFDAGQAWTLDEAPGQLAALAVIAPEFIEEPVADLLHLGHAPVPIAADESLQMPDAWRALATSCQVFALKPTTLGGLFACLRIARESGVQAYVSHAFEGPIAFAALHALARALPGALPAGLTPHAGLAAWPS